MIKMSEIKKFPLCVYTDTNSNEVSAVFGSKSFCKVVADESELKEAKKNGFRETLEKAKRGPKAAKKEEGAS